MSLRAAYVSVCVLAAVLMQWTAETGWTQKLEVSLFSATVESGNEKGPDGGEMNVSVALKVNTLILAYVAKSLLHMPFIFYHKPFTFLNKSDIIMAWSYRENGKCFYPLLCRIFASLVCEIHLSFQTRVKKSSLSVYVCFVNIAVFIFVCLCVHWLVLSSVIISEESLNLSLIACNDRLKKHYLVLALILQNNTNKAICHLNDI